MGIVPIGLLQSVVNKYMKDSSATQSATYVSVSATYSTSTAEASESNTNTSIRGIPIHHMKREVINMAGGTQELDIRFLVAASYLSSVTPKISDRVTIGGIDWEVQDFEPMEAGSTGLIYEFHLKR